MATCLRRPSVAVGIALVLAASVAAPAAAVWTDTIVDTMYYFTRPSLDVDSADHTGIASIRAGDSPGIFYSSNATGSWVTSRITSGTDSSPSLAIDSSDAPHVGFARRTGTTGIYLTENTTGSWTAPVLAAADLDPTSPSLDVNATGKVGVAYTSTASFDPGLFFVTNASGSWVKTRLLSATWARSPWLHFDGGGKAHILFSRLESESRGIYYATNVTGSWVITEVDDVHGDSIQFVFDNAGKIHASFRTYDPGGVPRGRYLTNHSGSWVATRLPGDFNVPMGLVTIGFDPAGGDVHIFATIHSDQFGRGHLFHYTATGGSCCAGAADVPQDGRDDSAPSLGFRSDGRIQLAFRRLYPSAGLRFFEFGATSSLVVESALVNSAASIDLGPGGVRNVAYDKVIGSGGSSIFATRSGASWTKELAGTGNGALIGTDIATDGAGKVRIVDGANYYSNATGTWGSDLSLPSGSNAEVEVDGSAHAHVLTSNPLWPYWQMDYLTNATGSWVSSPPLPATAFDGDPQGSLAVDAAGKAHIAWISYDSPSVQTLRYQNRISGSWTTIGNQVSGGVNAWPSIAIDAAGKAHVAYLHYGTSSGVYYATNKTGSWVATRLTRSYSDGAPSIALDSAGHVYVATTRAASAATPGIYVMTNRTGSWVVTRVVATEVAGNVSLTVTSTGLARFVYDSDVAVHEYENSTATLSVGAAPTYQDGTFTELIRSQLAERALAALPKAGAALSFTGPAVSGGSTETEPSTSVSIPRFGSSAP